MRYGKDRQAPGISALRRKYLAGFPEKIRSLREAIARGDCNSLARLIHQLAGSSGSYGFNKLSQCCLGLEEKGVLVRGDPGTIKQMLEEVLVLMQDIYEREYRQGAAGDCQEMTKDNGGDV